MHQVRWLYTKKMTKDKWEKPIGNLMSEEKEYDHEVSPSLIEGPADCITVPYRLLLL